MPDNPDTSLDIIERLYFLAQAMEIAIAQPRRRSAAALAREAAATIRKLRRRIGALEVRLVNVDAAGEWP